MLFNNSRFGSLTKPYKESLYTVTFEESGNPLPPPPPAGPTVLITLQGTMIFTKQGTAISLEETKERYRVVTIRGNYVKTITGNQVVIVN